MLKLTEDDADALKYVGVLTIYKILFIYVYIYVVNLLVRMVNKKTGCGRQIEMFVMYFGVKF